MAKIVFTQEEIDNYVKGKYMHRFYERAKEIAEKMAVHADGKTPEKLLWERRPNEPQEVMDYRKKIFTPKTKPTFSKIFSSLQKIRRSSDWSIRYEKQEEFTKITDGEKLEDYCEYNYPSFTSLTNWVFTLMLRKYLIDPNAVVYVSPMTWQVEQTDYLQPIAQVFDSVNVIDFVEDDYTVLLDLTGSTYIANRKPVHGKRFYICTTQQILIYDQVDSKEKFQLAVTINHALGILPAFKLKGVIIDQVDNRYLYESRIGGIIPELDEAIREYSDLQAAKVLHIYPERWEFTQHECTSCKGTALRPNPAYTPTCNCPAQIACDKCNNGYVVAGPYSKIMVKPPAMGEQQIPTPPAGFVEKDIEIVKVMEQGIRDHIFNALAAINFQFLEQTPLNESGKAKEVDKDELNNTVHGIAEDIVSAMDNIYQRIAYFRYKELYTTDEIDNMLPFVPVPEKFDLMSSAHIQEELKSAKDSKFNPVIISALEESYSSSKFNTDPAVRDKLMLILTLDPLPNISEDDKMSRLSNQGITLESYVISSNIQEFIQRAVQEEKGFLELELTKQKEILSGYAQEVITENGVSVNDEDAGLNDNGLPIDDLTGKIPLAVQQLSLAATRAAESGDTVLAATIKAKISQLLGKLVDAAEGGVVPATTTTDLTIPV